MQREKTKDCANCGWSNSMVWIWLKWICSECGREEDKDGRVLKEGKKNVSGPKDPW